MTAFEVAANLTDPSASRFGELYWVNGKVLSARLRKKAAKAFGVAFLGVERWGY